MLITLFFLDGNIMSGVKNHIDSLNDHKIIGCRKNILSIFVALLTFYYKEKKEENITF
jgi:hypothetical protein